jgi:hypothetical protein
MSGQDKLLTCANSYGSIRRFSVYSKAPSKRQKMLSYLNGKFNCKNVGSIIRTMIAIVATFISPSMIVPVIMTLWR